MTLLESAYNKARQVFITTYSLDVGAIASLLRHHLKKCHKLEVVHDPAKYRAYRIRDSELPDAHIRPFRPKTPKSPPALFHPKIWTFNTGRKKNILLLGSANLSIGESKNNKNFYVIGQSNTEMCGKLEPPAASTVVITSLKNGFEQVAAESLIEIIQDRTSEWSAKRVTIATPKLPDSGLFTKILGKTGSFAVAAIFTNNPIDHFPKRHIQDGIRFFYCRQSKDNFHGKLSYIEGTEKNRNIAALLYVGSANFTNAAYCHGPCSNVEAGSIIAADGQAEVIKLRSAVSMLLGSEWRNYKPKPEATDKTQSNTNDDDLEEDKFKRALYLSCDFLISKGIILISCRKFKKFSGGLNLCSVSLLYGKQKRLQIKRPVKGFYRIALPGNWKPGWIIEFSLSNGKVVSLELPPLDSVLSSASSWDSLLDMDQTLRRQIERSSGDKRSRADLEQLVGLITSDVRFPWMLLNSSNLQHVRHDPLLRKRFRTGLDNDAEDRVMEPPGDNICQKTEELLRLRIRDLVLEAYGI